MTVITALRSYPYFLRLVRSAPYGALRRITRRKFSAYGLLEPFIVGGRIFEIGGPSPIFREGGLIPTYNRCSLLDSCNYSERTIWTSSTFSYPTGGTPGTQYVFDATNLHGIPDGTYDLVLASHVLEHIANPIRALCEWKRILKPECAMLIIVPDRRKTFDHLRNFTSFEHLRNDFLENRQEDDLTHLDEILRLHDLSLDPGAGSPEQFRQRCLQNREVRAMHHHVFSEDSIQSMCSFLEMRLLSLTFERPDHMILLAQRSTQTYVQ